MPQSLPVLDAFSWNVDLVSDCDWSVPVINNVNRMTVATIKQMSSLTHTHTDSDICGVELICCFFVPGQERYGNMTRVYYREAVGALVVFDVTRASTFEAVLKWKDDLDSKVSQTQF